MYKVKIQISFPAQTQIQINELTLLILENVGVSRKLLIYMGIIKILSTVYWFQIMIMFDFDFEGPIMESLPSKLSKFRFV